MPNPSPTPEAPVTTIHGVIERGRYSKKLVAVWCAVPVKPVSERFAEGDAQYAPFWTGCVNCPDCITAAEAATAQAKA